MTPDDTFGPEALSTSLRRWADSQIRALIALGIDAIEAERSMQWVLVHLPPGADPNTYLFPAELLDEPLDQTAVDDARIAYYANDAVPSQYKRLLDARAAVDRG